MDGPIDLPVELSLPLSSGEPWWYFIGGRVSVDFANTLRERWWRRVETLVTDRDLVRWLVRAGVLVGEPAVPSGALRAARDLREAIDGALTAAIDGRSPARRDVTAIDRWLRRSVTVPRLGLGPDDRLDLDVRPAADPVSHALGLVALDAARILAEPELRRRLRVCASESCSARFFDNSPAGRRQWCSMSTCGNVAKARRFRARQSRNERQQEMR
jgi:predicted RNA-binding Zn ribbon-like protein